MNFHKMSIPFWLTPVLPLREFFSHNHFSSKLILIEGHESETQTLQLKTIILHSLHRTLTSLTITRDKNLRRNGFDTQVSIRLHCLSA